MALSPYSDPLDEGCHFPITTDATKNQGRSIFIRTVSESEPILVSYLCFPGPPSYPSQDDILASNGASVLKLEGTWESNDAPVLKLESTSNQDDQTDIVVKKPKKKKFFKIPVFIKRFSKWAKNLMPRLLQSSPIASTSI